MTQSDAKYYENESLWAAENFENERESNRLSACLELIPEDARTLLDVGCGNGAFLSLVERKRNMVGAFGVDRSKAALANGVCAAPMSAATIEQLPFSCRSFHFVSALDVIEHLPFGRFEAGLVELGRVAERYILINVPFREKRLKLTCPYCGCAFDPHYHMRTFDLAKLAGLFDGFKIVSKRWTHSRINLLAAIARPIRRRVFGAYPPTAVCPQCGFHDDAKALTSRSPVTLRARVKATAEHLPTVKVLSEVAALFARR